VACVAAVPAGSEQGSEQEQRIVTGGGDGTVRLWRASDGELLSTVVLAEPFPEEEAEAKEGGAVQLF
jgi:WD40 repeat protein